jgi:glycosyltransferase involved in cell wall biosynthesis
MVAYAFYEVDTRILQYAKALTARGDEVEVIALRREGQEICGTVDGVKVYRIQQRRVNEKRKLDYLLRICLFFFRAMYCLIGRHLRDRYDVIHVHSVPDCLVFASWFPKLLGARVILDIHDMLPEFFVSKFNVKADSWAFRMMLVAEKVSASFADHVIIANHLWRERLIQRSVQSEKVTVLLNYPDRSLFRPGSPRPNSEKLVLLYPGTLNRHQGLDVAVRAFARIYQQMPNVEFHIYGEGPMLESLQRLAEELKLTERVRFSGFQPINEVVAAMQGADLGVVPKDKTSFGNEAFSTKILEFMSVGVPVVVSDTAIDRYYFHEQVVRFFRSGDDTDLAKALLELLQSAERRKQLSRNALEFIERFDWDVYKDVYLSLVDSLNKRSPCLTRTAGRTSQSG